MQPTFEYIPTFSGLGNTTPRILQINGLTTAHGNTASDRGRLYGSVTLSAGTYTLTLFSDRMLTKSVLTGTTTSLQTMFNLVAANGSNLTGVAQIDAYAADDASIVAIPTFAVDEDVILHVVAKKFPGYDASYGFAYFHAGAMRQILTCDLPAAVPNLYPSKTGMAGIVPNLLSPAMPDLRQLANIDHLRMAQQALTKRLIALTVEHVEQYALMAKNEGERYEQVMAMIEKSNVLQQEAEIVEESERSTVFGTFGRV